MRKIVDWLSKNKAAAGLFLAAVVVALLPVAGCRVVDIIKVTPPLEVQRGLGIPPKVSLSDAERHLKTWMAAAEDFADEISYGYEVAGWLSAAFGLSIEAAKASFPQAGWAVALLGALATLFVPKPGTDRMVSEEKMASFNKGRKEMENLFVPLLREAGIAVPDMPAGKP